MKAKEFYLIPNKSFAYPVDFWINNMRFGFVDDQLTIKQTMIEQSPVQNIPHRDDAVISIHEIRSDLFKDLNTIKQFEQESEKKPLVLEIGRNGLKMTITRPINQKCHG